jgi:ATP-binding cassette subfamily C (CFTR/MRP) protein 1
MSWLGYKKYITEEDLWALPPSDQAEAVAGRLEKQWNAQLKKKKYEPFPTHLSLRVLPSAFYRPSLLIALLKAYGGSYFVGSIFKFLQDILAFTQPQLLRRLLIFVDSFKSAEPEPLYHGYIVRPSPTFKGSLLSLTLYSPQIAVLMFACAMLQSAFVHQYFQVLFRYLSFHAYPSDIEHYFY